MDVTAVILALIAALPPTLAVYMLYRTQIANNATQLAIAVETAKDAAAARLLSAETKADVAEVKTIATEAHTAINSANTAALETQAIASRLEGREEQRKETQATEAAKAEGREEMRSGSVPLPVEIVPAAAPLPVIETKK